jgi:hypothetical protein
MKETTLCAHRETGGRIGFINEWESKLPGFLKEMGHVLQSWEGPKGRSLLV